MDLREFLKNNILISDGGMGSLLQKSGLPLGVLPERWNLEKPEVIREIHKAYFDAGSNMVSTNTFGANPLKFSDDELKDIIFAAVKIAQDAKKESISDKEKFVALDIGPLGHMLKPYGDLDFEDAVNAFKKIVSLGQEAGADAVIIETMNDAYETKAAVVAAKEACKLPLIVSNAYSEDGKLLSGTTPRAMVALLEGLGVDALGCNCSLGPEKLKNVVEELLEYSSIPVIFQPNAGLPKIIGNVTFYDVDEDEYVACMADEIRKGVRIAGGCCGTTPSYIKKLSDAVSGLKPVPVKKKEITIVSSYIDAVVFDKEPVLIGERINPTGKKKFKQALIDKDIPYILNEGIRQTEKGVHILDVNVGLPDIDEKEMLVNVVKELQAVTSLPLQLDTADPDAMEAAMRIYNGKPLINSVNGKEEVMDSIFPLVKKYGGAVIALTLDENGIPETSEGRFRIAEKILSKAAEYGIDRKDIIFDTLTMTVATNPEAGNITVSALKKIRDELNCHTSLGVSNISFGMPNRDEINAEFYLNALNSGLSAAIMNPYSYQMMKTYYSFRALKGFNGGEEEYKNFLDTNEETVNNVAVEERTDFASGLQKAIIKGLKEEASSITSKMLDTTDGMEIVEKEIIPSLNIVGQDYEEKRAYLPQLLMSAEAASACFEVIKYRSQNGRNRDRGSVILATVKGDIHDIGKNIVKLLLENYGFNVIDLGKDVDPEIILETAKKENVKLVGLSALMTTTVVSMEKTIKLLKEEYGKCKVVVGGAVLTKSYAEKIGADHYSKDAMETVRYAESLNLK
ncbi:MAG: homocysteine S-methyltransferase family protein [Clostridia bacterium]|nr:homocysteine S-methyltransferase family protein [Clostridia bacterium]